MGVYVNQPLLLLRNNKVGFRFRKSFKLAPGVRMNLSGSGVGWTLGPHGASIGIGKRGTFLNAGIPGTGLSSRGRIDGTSVPRSTRSTTPQTTLSITVGVRDDGTVYFHDTEGNPLPERAITAAKKQRGDVIRSLIEQKCDEINEQIGAVGYIHVYTPHPNVQPKHEIRDFESRPPVKPVPKTSGFFASLFKSRRDRIAKENALAEQQYALALRHWQAEKEHFEDEEGRRKAFIEHDIYTDLPAMEAFLEENLQAITWPRETTVSAAILELGKWCLSILIYPG